MLDSNMACAAISAHVASRLDAEIGEYREQENARPFKRGRLGRAYGEMDGANI